MKRLVVFLAIWLGMSGIAAHAQDLIVLRDGNMIEAKVTEISASEIRYKRANHLDGPTIVVSATLVLSIRYSNGKVDIISALPPAPAPAAARPAAPPPAAPAPAAARQPAPSGGTGANTVNAGSLPGTAGAVGAVAMDVAAAAGVSILSLQDALNRLPAIPIAGKTLKFVFAGETWRAQVSGKDTLSGTLTFQGSEGGGIIILKPTHAYVMGRQVPTPAPEILLEYTPPMSLRAMSKSEAAAAGVTSGSGSGSGSASGFGSAIVLSHENGWWPNLGPNSTGQVDVNRETIAGQQVDVLAVEVNVKKMEWAGATTENEAIAEQLRGAAGIRFKALGDGKPWQLIINMPETSTDGGSYRIEIKTKKGKVVEIDVPFSKLKQPPWGKRAPFNKDSIEGMAIERGSHQGLGASSIKVFDIEVY